MFLRKKISQQGVTCILQPAVAVVATDAERIPAIKIKAYCGYEWIIIYD